MKYSSTACQERDAVLHSPLCSTFKDFQWRPRPDHFRSIYFPVDEFRPRFIWLRLNGGRGFHIVDDDDLSQYVSGQRSGALMTSTHYRIVPPREYTTMMVIEHDRNMSGNGQPLNLCLDAPIGPTARRCLVGYVSCGYKYNYSV